MKRRSLSRYWKFLPLVALFAFGVTLISLPKGTEATQLGPPILSQPVVPVGGTITVTARYSDDDPTPNAGLTATLAATPAIGTFLNTASVSPAAADGAEIVTAAGTIVTVTDDLDTVSTVKTITAPFQCTQPGVVTFTITHSTVSAPSSALVCGDLLGGQYPGYPGYPGYGYPTGACCAGYPTNTTAYGTAAAVTVSASPASTTCTSPSTISITVKDVNGNLAPNGTSVTVSASTGTISPNVVSTSGGYATTTFMAPDNTNGTATVTATSGTGTGYATVAFSCTGTSTTAPVYAPPSAYPTYGGPAVIMPPNTGDAGLASSASTSTTAGIALVALSVLGLSAGAYSLSRQRNER